MSARLFLARPLLEKKTTTMRKKKKTTTKKRDVHEGKEFAILMTPWKKQLPMTCAS